MIPYRRQRAIEGRAPMVAGDVTTGDIVLIRRPGAVDLTPETVRGVTLLPSNKSIRLRFDGFDSEHSSAIPIGMVSYTAGSWRQLH